MFYTNVELEISMPPGKPCKFSAAPWLSNAGYLAAVRPVIGYILLLTREMVSMTLPKFKFSNVLSLIPIRDVSAMVGAATKLLREVRVKAVVDSRL